MNISRYWLFLALPLLVFVLLGCNGSTKNIRAGAPWSPGDITAPGGEDTAPPVVTGSDASTTTPAAGEVILLSVTATDDSGEDLTYAWDDGGAGGTFTGSGNSIAWNIDTPGTYTISVTITDASGNETTRTFEITVGGEEPPPPLENDPPVFEAEMSGDVSAPVATQRIKFTAQATDPDGDAITYSWSDSGGGTFTDEAVSEEGKASVFWAADAAGSFAVTCTADDGNGGVTEVSYDVTVDVLPADFDYVGYETCGSCHTEGFTPNANVDGWLTTAHSSALENSINPSPYGNRNESCYVCHAVGFEPVGEGGFIDQEITPQFANIQCESCHGGGNPPGAGEGHKPLPWDPGLGYERDTEGNFVVVDGEYQYIEDFDGSEGYGCGLCHEGSRHGAFEEWAQSGHATFALYEEDGVTPEHNVSGTSCMKCHNGAYYVSIQIRGEDPPQESLTEVDESAHISCATCHDPHSDQYKHQLRVDSEAAVIIPFDDTAVYADAANICITCHDGRRTRDNRDSHITNGSKYFGMHPNNQGPMLFGIAGFEFDGITYDSEHPHNTWNEEKCVTCHMYQQDYISSEEPAIWGHTWEPRVEACFTCHVGTEVEFGVFVEDFEAEIEALMTEFVNVWPVAWKDVTDPDNPVLYSRPDTSDPPAYDGPPKDDPIGNQYRQALWNYTYIEEDDSHGIHNPSYTEQLLQTSIDKVNELSAG